MADVLSVIADVLKQDKQQKREHNKIMKEVQKKLKEKGSEEVAEEEGDKEDYMKFFAGKLKKYGVKSPSELDDEKKKKFFNEIEKDWTHDSKEEVEVEKKEENLGKRVKARMEAEDEEENEDEDPVGDSDEEEADTDAVEGGEPTEDELEKLADLVVQKIKDKADDEEEEEEEPDATEAESGKEEKIEVNPKMEQVRNPHARNTWEAALRQVYAVNEEINTDDHDLCPTCDDMHAPGECPLKTKDGKEGKLVEGQDTSWIDPHARKVERKWKSMNKSARKKWLQTMADKAGDNDTKQEVLDDVLDDYGLTEELTPNYTDLRGDGDEGTTTSDPDKDYGLHQFSDPKYKPAYTDQSFQTVPDKTGIGQDLGDKQSGTPKKAKGQATAAKAPAKVDAKGGMDKPVVGTKSDTPDKATGKATATKISPEVTTKDGVSTHKEDVDRAKDDSIEGPAKGKKHKCPTHVKKEGYGYGKNISHTLSENVVDKMNIYWYDSKEVSYMMPTSEVEIVSEGYHDETNHAEKFKSTKKIAEELSKLPNPFETTTTTKIETPKVKITEKRSVSFARKFYQKGDK